MESDSEDENEKIEYTKSELFNLENIIVKISDFGSCIKKNRCHGIHQTIYYRAPELILNIDFNNSVDVWSIGCTIFEMLTGKILFNPDTQTVLCDERFYVSKIDSYLGSIPEHMINRSPCKWFHYRKNNLLRCKDSDNKYFVTSLMQKNDNTSDFLLLFDFIKSCLEIDYLKRKNVVECLIHELFINKKF